MKYDEIFTFNNLYKAHLKARLSKRYKKEVIEFELNTGSNISKLFYELKYHKYKISGYNTFYIYEPKKRKVDALSYKDRIVQHCLCDNYLTPLLEKRLIYDNAATRINKGTDFARKRLKNFYYDYYNKNKNNNGYVLKCDIHHFFESIDHNILKNLLSKDIDDDNILKLLFKIIDSYENEANKGLPIGNQTSQAFAIRYLDEMDRIIKENCRVKYYIRYMDDFLLIHNDKEYLKYVLNKIIILLNKKYLLTLNTKTRIYKLSESVEFLGFNYQLLNNGTILMKLNGKKRKIFKNKIVKRKQLLNKCLISSEKYQATLMSYNSHIRKGNNYYFYKFINQESKNGSK